MEDKYLILGDGALGTELYKQTGWKVISRKKNGFDITILDSYENLIEPDRTVINVIGYTNTYDISKKMSLEINYVAFMKLVNLCQARGNKLVHISSDYIYANSAKNCRYENDVPVHAQNWYSYSKLLSDAYIQAIMSNYLLIRTSFKPRPFPYPSATDALVGNFDYIDVIASLIIRLIDAGARGIFNVGTKTKTIHDLAVQSRPDVIKTHKLYYKTMPGTVEMSLGKMEKFLNG